MRGPGVMVSQRRSVYSSMFESPPDRPPSPDWPTPPNRGERLVYGKRFPN